jgi:hypothetical protein
VKLVESLRDMEVAATLLDTEGPQLSLQQKYAQLNCELNPVLPDTDEFAMIGRCVLCVLLY